MNRIEFQEPANPRDYGVAHREAKRNFRTECWKTKGGREIPIKDMDDNHVFNAYRVNQDAALFREMVLRLFETKLEKTNDNRYA